MMITTRKTMKRRKMAKKEKRKRTTQTSIPRKRQKTNKNASSNRRHHFVQRHHLNSSFLWIWKTNLNSLKQNLQEGYSFDRWHLWRVKINLGRICESCYWVFCRTTTCSSTCRKFLWIRKIVFKCTQNIFAAHVHNKNYCYLFTLTYFWIFSVYFKSLN